MGMEEKIYEELVKIRELLELLVRDEIKKELELIATTDERKRIWALCDGLTSTAEIADKVGVSQRTVQFFISQLEEKDLIVIKRRGRPKRRIDYIPSSWKLAEVSRLG